MERTHQALNVAFAEVLRRQREAAGLTQEQLSELADVSTRHISFLETGKRQPTLAVLVALCAGLGVTLAGFASDLDKQMMASKDRSDDR